MDELKQALEGPCAHIVDGVVGKVELEQHRNFAKCVSVQGGQVVALRKMGQHNHQQLNVCHFSFFAQNAALTCTYKYCSAVSSLIDVHGGRVKPL